MYKYRGRDTSIIFVYLIYKIFRGFGIMKKIAIGITLVAVLGCVGYTSYSLVRFAKSKSEKRISSRELENAKTANSDSVNSMENKGENSKQNSLENAQNQAPSSPSPTDYTVVQDENLRESTEGELDFSSPDAFILSYNTLIKKVGTDVTREDVRSEYYKAAMRLTTVDNVEVWSYQHDNSIRVIYIKGKDMTKEVREHINGTAKVFFENGNTVIDVNINN